MKIKVQVITIPHFELYLETYKSSYLKSH